MEMILTIISGFSIFVLGQIFLKLVIEPTYQLKKTMANVSNTFVSYAYALQNTDQIPQKLDNKVYEKLRGLSGQLYEDVALMPKRLYKNKYFRKLFFLPKEEKVYDGAQNIIAIGSWMGLKNHINTFEEIVKNMQKACDNLGLYINPRDRIPDDEPKEDPD